jgi:hypothetical protein
MTDIQNKSKEELLALIAEAQTQLETLRRSQRKEVIAQIVIIQTPCAKKLTKLLNKDVH